MAEGKRARGDIYRERLEVYNRESHLIGRVWGVAGPPTVQLFGLDERGKPRPIGTGVLFRNGNRLFILTAAHAADEFRDKPAFIRLGTKLLELRGHTHASVYPKSKTRNDDTLDYAAVRIDGDVAGPMSELAITAADVYNPPPGVVHGKGLVVAGFLARNVKKKGAELNCDPTAMETHGVMPETYKTLGLDPNDHQLMRWYNTMYTPKGVVRSPSLAGLSGSGVWLVPELMGEAFPAYAPWTRSKLIGIFTEHRKTRSVLLATKIHCHLDRIMREYGVPWIASSPKVSARLRSLPAAGRPPCLSPGLPVRGAATETEG